MTYYKRRSREELLPLVGGTGQPSPGDERRWRSRWRWGREVPVLQPLPAVRKPAVVAVVAWGSKWGPTASLL